MSIVRMGVRLDWSGGGSPGANVWNIRTPSTPQSAGDPVLTGWRDALLAFYTSLVGSTVFFRSGLTVSFQGQVVDEENKSIYTVTPFSLTGQVTNTNAPLIAQAVLTLRTPYASRSGRGRKFIGPLADASIGGDGALATAAQTRLQNAANTLLGRNATPANGAIGIYSRRTNTIRDVTQWVAQPYIAALRSRRD